MIEYITITPEHFQHQPGKIEDIPVSFEGEIDAIRWKNLEIPEKLNILKGYQKPDYSEAGGGFPEFSGWIKKTLDTKDKATISDSITFLQLKDAYYDWLFHINDYFSKDGRIQSRLEDGIEQLKTGLEALT